MLNLRVIAMIGLFAPTAATAQGLALESGLFVRREAPPSETMIERRFVPGVRVAVEFANILALDTEFSYGRYRTLGPVPQLGNALFPFVRYQLIQSRFATNPPVTERIDLRLGAGISYNAFSGLRYGPRSGAGLGALAGLSYRVNHYLSLRGDYTAHRVGTQWSHGFQIGFGTQLVLAERASDLD